MKIGIYKFTNKITNKSYIGQSINIEKRFEQHSNNAYNSNIIEYNYPFYRAIRKYGIENFTFEILELCSIEELSVKEKYYIDKYDTFKNGYNLTIGGEGKSNWTKEEIDFIMTNIDKTNKELSKYINHPINSISAKKRELGIYTKKMSRWTKQEEEELKELIKIYNNKWTKIGEIMGRSAKSVLNKAKRLGYIS